MKKNISVLFLCIVTSFIHAQNFVDLGLPSGTLWKNQNEAGGFYTYEEAVAEFGSSLPTKIQWNELLNSCSWTWEGNDLKLIGPSGESIILPAAGCRGCDGSLCNDGFSSYWSSTPLGSESASCLSFHKGAVQVFVSYRCFAHSVRLVCASTAVNDTIASEGNVIEFVFDDDDSEIFVMVQPPEDEEPVSGEDPVYKVVEQMPEFPGGDDAMIKYFADNLRYPQIAKENEIQGRVICQFVVERDGSISDVQIVYSNHDPSLEKEALRLIRSMPRWKPGKQQGAPVRVQYTVPINFRL